eukprot:1143427-Pelagomonas_calceolata.AAC.5
MSIACTAWHPSSKSMSGLAQRQAVPAPAALQLCFIQYHITSSFAAPARLKIVCRARIALLTHCSMELPALLPLDSPLGSQYHAAWTPNHLHTRVQAVHGACTSPHRHAYAMPA